MRKAGPADEWQGFPQPGTGQRKATTADGQAGADRIARPHVSIIITSHNYAAYIRQCIDSALEQKGAGREFGLDVLVVDNYSSDGSRAIIASYGNRIGIILREEGRQISSFNHGFAASRGGIVIFLDADDYLAPDAVLTHLAAFRDPAVVRSQGYMTVVGPEGQELGRRLPGRCAPQGDLSRHILTTGPGAVVSAPTSGNAWRRDVLERIMPLPETVLGIGADTYLMDSVPLFGRVAVADREVAFYRLHGRSFGDAVKGLNRNNIAVLLEGYRTRTQRLSRTAGQLRLEPQAARWAARNWRIQTLEGLLSRLEGRSGPGFGAQLAAAAAARSLKGQARALLIVLASRLLPLPWALRVAQGSIRLNEM